MLSRSNVSLHIGDNKIIHSCSGNVLKDEARNSRQTFIFTYSVNRISHLLPLRDQENDLFQIPERKYAYNLPCIKLQQVKGIRIGINIQEYFHVCTFRIF